MPRASKGLCSWFYFPQFPKADSLTTIDAPTFHAINSLHIARGRFVLNSCAKHNLRSRYVFSAYRLEKSSDPHAHSRSLSHCVFPAAAQDKPADEKKPEEVSKVDSIEVTPAQSSIPVGGKLQFKAVGKDAAGQPLPDTVKHWFVAPFDAAVADEKGEVSFVEPGEILVGAMMGKKVGYAHITVAKPHISAIAVTAPAAPLATGSSYELTATPRNASGDPRTDIALTWSSQSPAIASVDSAGMVRALKPGKALIRASGDGVTGEATITVVKNAVTGLTLSPNASSAKTGDVVHFSAKDKKGATIPVEIAWSVEQNGAQIWPDGAFVRSLPGTYTVFASVGDRDASASIVVAPRDVLRDLEVVGHVMPKDEQFAEEWIWDHYAYLSAISDKLYIFDIADPAHPQSADPLKVDARLINDVSVTADGKIGVITREGASNRKNASSFWTPPIRFTPKFFPNTLPPSLVEFTALTSIRITSI